MLFLEIVWGQLGDVDEKEQPLFRFLIFFEKNIFLLLTSTCFYAILLVSLRIMT